MGKRITKDIMYDKLDMLKRMSELELDIETSAGRYAVYTSEGHNKLYGRRLSPFGTAKEIWNWMDAFHDGFALGWSACEKKWPNGMFTKPTKNLGIILSRAICKFDTVFSTW